MKKRIIFDNYDVDINDLDYDFGTGELSIDEKYEFLYDELNQQYADERSNLDKYLAGNIIAIADLGLWNGRQSGYTVLNNNLNSILNGFDCDYITVYQDRYNVRSKCIHHDGTNYILFRMLRPEFGFWELDHFYDLLCTGKASDRDIRRYTVSLNPEIDKIYGKV